MMLLTQLSGGNMGVYYTNLNTFPNTVYPEYFTYLGGGWW